jgi:predicted transcriptional regulator
MQAATTIHIRKNLKCQLDALKRHPEESYSDVIERLVAAAVDDEPLSKEAIRGLEEAFEDIEKGNLISEEKIKAKFGVE